MLAYLMIAVLCSVLVVCGYCLKKELKQRSDERTNERRAKYRYEAYKAMNEKYDLRKSRERLWKSLQK
jgi:hypothetical protein